MSKRKTLDLNRQRHKVLSLNLYEAKFLQNYTELVSRNYGLKELKETSIDGYNAIKKLDQFVEDMEKQNDVLSQAIKAGLIGGCSNDTN